MFRTTQDGRIAITEETGQEHVFNTRQEAFKWLHGVDTSAEAPSVTMALEQMGVLSDSNVRLSATKTPRSLGKDDQEPWKTRMTASSLWRIAPQWFAGVQTKLDNEFRGKPAPQLLEAFKAVDSAAQSSAVEQDKLRDLFGQDLKEFAKEKREDVFAFLSTEQRFWPQMKTRLAMSDKEMEHISNLRQSLAAVDSAHHLGVFNYFVKDLPRLERFNHQADTAFTPVTDPAKAGFFHRGIMTGKFDSSDRDAGHFINYVISGIGDRALEKPLYDLKEVMNQKYKDGGYVLGNLRKPVQQYIDYMEHTPDFSQRIANRITQDMGNAFLKQASKVNKFLPAKIQIPDKIDNPQAALNKLMSLSYASAIVGRVAAPMKDVMNTFTNTLPILGFKNFSRAVGELNAAGWAEAKEAGAHLHGMNIGELYGDIYQEIPTGGAGQLDKAVTLAGKMMAPSRWSHNTSRTVAYLGSHRGALDAIKDLRAGKITSDKFISDSGTWFLTKAERSRYLAKAVDKTIEPTELAKDIALTIVDRTQWPYRRGTQPLALRTGVGRIFGQFGTWPMNEVEYLRTLGERALEGGPVTKRALIAAGTWVAMNYAVYETLHSADIDAKKWLFISPSAYTGGPMLQLIQDLLKSPDGGMEGTAESRAARKRIIETPLEIIPAANEMGKIFDIAGDTTGKYNTQPWTGDITPDGVVHLLGFTPVNDKQEERWDNYDLEQQLRYGAGFKTDRYNDDLEQELKRDIGQ
jgi:hypothetical protein